MSEPIGDFGHGQRWLIEAINSVQKSINNGNPHMSKVDLEDLLKDLKEDLEHLIANITAQ